MYIYNIIINLNIFSLVLSFLPYILGKIDTLELLNFIKKLLRSDTFFKKFVGEVIQQLIQQSIFDRKP